MELHWVLACSGPSAGAAISRNEDIFLVCTALIALMAYGIFRLWGKRPAPSIGGVLLVVTLYFLGGPNSGGDCGYSIVAWAELCAVIASAVFVFSVFIFQLKKRDDALYTPNAPIGAKSER